MDTQIQGAFSARDLIRLAKERPPTPIVDGLLNEGDILLIHGSEESYKSVFVVQLGESIAGGTPFLRRWQVIGARRVGIIETEMHPASMGERLGKMFLGTDVPESLLFMNEERLQEWRRGNMAEKFRIIKEWVDQNGIEVLMIDTANDFFRGTSDPSVEKDVGEFFDRLRGLRMKGTILVRHDRKRREIDDISHSNELIRGSAEWKEDPETIVHIKRLDKRTHEVEMEVGKLRYGRKPEPMKLWFDSDNFRLTPLPPVIALAEEGQITREAIIDQGQRFGLATRTLDSQIALNRQFLRETKKGHETVFEINREACAEADWAEYLSPRSAR